MKSFQRKANDFSNRFLTQKYAVFTFLVDLDAHKMNIVSLSQFILSK